MDKDLVENELSFSTATRIALEVDQLSVLAGNNTPIVQDISMRVPSGSIIAIVGGSGSGKTTLLNVLASKMSRNLKKTGSFRFVPESPEHSGEITTAYLTQQDILAPKLTCRETLQYASDLKLRCSKNERRKLVEELIAELGLRDCATTLVGDSRHPGLSGGEKRRLSIGVQMIANPSLLFLDEPTTGLDAYSAFLVIKTLKKLSHKGGRTFIMSIHQPRADILFLLDQVCIMSKGQSVFCDKVVRMVPYFKELGYEVPPHVNPADYFIDLCSVDSRSPQLMLDTQARLDELVKNWKIKQDNFHPFSNPEMPPAVPTMPSVPFWRQVHVLTRRKLRFSLRDYTTCIAVLLEPVVIGVITGWIFYKPDGTSLKGLRTMTSALYSAGALQGYLFLLFEIYRLCDQDIKVYDRERGEGCVTPFSFLVSQRLANFVVVDFPVPFLFSIITYFMYGLSANAKSYFIYLSVVLLIHQSSVSFAMFSVAISRDFSQASLIGNLNYTLQSMACGFFVNAKSMPVYVRWTKYITYLWYSFGALMSNQFTDFACGTGEDGGCLGNMILQTFGFPRHWRTVPIIIVFCWTIAYYLSAVAILYLKKTDVGLAKRVKSKKKVEKVDPLMEVDVESNPLQAETSEEQGITIELCGINLKAQKKHFSIPRFAKKKGETTIDILNNIDAIFQPNALNAIMGPSGSGKSTLLNLLSGKLRSNIFASFETDGSILYNDTQVHQEVFKSICSFVPQDDDHLLPQLTVRETLAFAADLRLHRLKPKERSRKVDELITELGLKHCENTLVGSELVKGISGGEKRRVSMGTHLLTDPPVLLLDEPTSGLDSFTSFKILEVLSNISKKPGKTVILTIHQPRAEVFQQLGNILLLAKGGRIAFNGSPHEMIGYFSRLGFECPPLTNVADYFLDLISVNTQNETNEVISRKRVEYLLHNWEQEGQVFTKRSTDSSDKERYNVFEFEDWKRGKASFSMAYRVCVRRQFLTITRNMQSLSARLAQIPGVGIILALYYAPVKHNYASVSNRLGLIQQSTALYYTGMLTNLACYPGERNYFYQEFDDNIYGVTPFYLGYMTLELPMAAFASSLYAIFTVLVCGLNRTAGNFFVTMYCSLIISTCGEALGIITNTLFTTPGFVVNVVSIVLTIGCVMSGLMSLQMSRVLKGFNYLSPLNYTSMILINYAFPTDMKLSCNDGGRNSDGSCMLSSGKDVLESYGLKTDTRKYLGIIICVWFIYRFIAYLTLRAKLEWVRW